MSASEIQAKITYEEKEQIKKPRQRRQTEGAQDGHVCIVLHAAQKLSNATAQVCVRVHLSACGDDL